MAFNPIPFTSVTGERRVLIVEDDADLRHVYRLALSFAGFQVQEAIDGMDALRRIDADPPDLIVLDLMLPDLSGLVVQQEVAAHAHTRNIPVVIVTGSGINLDHVDVPCVLRKPITPEQLIETVRKCLNAEQGAGAS
jgi:DNA-binding response OmpR family regulator